jgi:hypothetical protein
MIERKINTPESLTLSTVFKRKLEEAEGPLLGELYTSAVPICFKDRYTKCTPVTALFLRDPECIPTIVFTTSNPILSLVSFCILFDWLKILSTSVFWPTETLQNVTYQFGILPLASLYSTASATEFVKLISIITVHSC